MPKSGKETYGWAAFNLGSYTKAELKEISKCDKIRSVTMVIDLLRKKVKDFAPVVAEKAANFIEIPDQYLDAGKLRKLGFSPKVNFEDGLDLTIDWYKKNFEHLAGLAQRYIAK